MLRYLENYVVNKLELFHIKKIWLLWWSHHHWQPHYSRYSDTSTRFNNTTGHHLEAVQSQVYKDRQFVTSNTTSYLVLNKLWLLKLVAALLPQTYEKWEEKLENKIHWIKIQPFLM